MYEVDERLEELARDEYISCHSSKELDLLTAISRDANFSLTHPRMVSGHIQGLFLKMMVELTAPKRVLEIGTFVGYATICLSVALEDDARLTTIEVNDELTSRIKTNLMRAGVADKVDLLMGDALALLQQLPLGDYQMVYLDANKAQYPDYFALLVEHLPKGALIIADNTLWGNKVWHDEYQDPQTVGIREFNRRVAEDSRVEQVILPVRDGLTMIKIL